jgi:folate-binding protein YgfZ
MLDTLDAATLGAFAAPTAELDAVLHGPVLARLDEFGRIRVDGPDAATFLQSQLTNDVANLDPSSVQLNGYCTPKGRLLATFQQWREADAIMLQLPAEILTPVMKRLSMFVLRAKAKLVDASAQHRTLALLGPGAAEALRTAGIEVPATPWHSVVADEMRVIRMPPAPIVAERFLLTVAAALADHLMRLGLPQQSSAAWWWSEVAAAIPTVFAATQEKFVPQMINFEVLGGVSFKKGCYPGQEIVARSQYLGKLKRRMQIAHSPADVPPPAGSDLYQSSQAEPVGTVVMSATAPGGGADLLIELPVDRIASGSLHLSPGSEPLQLRPLPYELFDPTA